MKLKIEDWSINLREELMNKEREEIRRDIEKYLDGKLSEFNYSIDLSGFTSFQRTVLEEIMKIPYGKTLSYSELAENVNKLGSQRAVGNVCNINPLPVIIPCHRVVAKDGIGGYSYNLDLKRYLLKLEGVKTDNF